MKKLMMMAMVAATMVGAAQAGEVAVANASTDNKTLAFYYMDAAQTNELQGTVYVVPENLSDTEMPPWGDDMHAECTKVDFDVSFANYRPKSTANWFGSFSMLGEITNIQNLDTSSVMSMYCMFDNCTSLTALDMSGFDTAKVTNMGRMFNFCLNLKTIYASGAFKIAQVTESVDMFTECTALVGGSGTGYDENHTDAAYARIDNPPDALGYFTTKPLTFTAEEDGSTVTFGWKNGSDVMINTNGTWVAYTAGTKITLAKVGDKVMFKGSGVTTDRYNYFTMTGKIAASGDVGTLTDGKGGADVKLTEKCYYGMFYGCTSLTAAPVLPATNLASYCYNGMFQYCSSLTAAPVLSATNLTSGCYSSMFKGCAALTAAPVLPATNLVEQCYYSMFYSCSSLKVNQEGPGTEWLIPAENEAKGWSRWMFEGTPGTVPSDPSTNVTYYVVPTVAFKPEEVENATWEIIEDNGVWPLRDKVHTNATIKVRYTAKDGLAFEDGSYVKTVLVGKADADPFEPTGYAPAAPQEWTQATASTTVDIDTRTDKTYFDADDILPIWVLQSGQVRVTNTWMVAEEKMVISYDNTTTTNWYSWKPAYLGKYELTLKKSGKPVFSPEAITYTTPVYVSTNAALDVAGTTWTLTDAGGSPITAMDEEGRYKVPTNSQLKVVYTPTKEGYYFKDGKTTYEAAFTATGAEYFDAATMIGDNKPKAGDIGQPKVQLGIVAQRYPWDGCLDVNYRALYTPAETYKLKVTVTVEDVAKDVTTKTTITSGIHTFVYDVKADFGEVKTKNCKVKAELVTP